MRKCRFRCLLLPLKGGKSAVDSLCVEIQANPEDDLPEGTQLWVDLPEKHKVRRPTSLVTYYTRNNGKTQLSEPTYQELKASRIPAAHPSEGVEVTVISGSSQGSAEEGLVTGPIDAWGGCNYWKIKMANKGSKVWQDVPQGWSTFVRWWLCLHSTDQVSTPCDIRPTSSLEVPHLARARPSTRSTALSSLPARMRLGSRLSPNKTGPNSSLSLASRSIKRSSVRLTVFFVIHYHLVLMMGVWVRTDRVWTVCDDRCEGYPASFHGLYVPFSLNSNSNPATC
jgi:hypothetical protein